MGGDPVATLVSKTGGLSPTAAQAQYDYYNNLFGLNKSLPVQYLNFWTSKLLPYTVALLIPAILLSWWTGNSFGALAARRKWLDNAVLPVGYVLTATPYMWLALVLSFVLSFSLRIFPLSGGYGFNLEPTLTWLFFTDLVAHWVLPFLSLFLVMFGGWAIGMRNMIIYELESDYSRYLETLGAPQSLIRKYAFRNAMLPQLTGLALQLGVIVAGALVTEIVFSYPGVGSLLFASIRNEDYFLLQGIFMFIIVGVLLANFVVDIVYVIVDPRTRVAMRGGTA